MWYETSIQFEKFDNIARMHICKRDNAVYVCDCVHVVESLGSFDVFLLLCLQIPFPSPQLPIHWYGLLPLLPNP